MRRYSCCSAAVSCRHAIVAVLGIKNPSRLFFTSGATESYNLILRSIEVSGKICTVSAFEHNAILRPLWALTGEVGIRIVYPDECGSIATNDLCQRSKDASFVFINHCSNVIGAVQNLSALSKAAHDANGALLIADVSQSAGVMPLQLENSGVDIAVFTGHKAFFGPAGIGGFYLRVFHPQNGEEPAPEEI